MMLDVASGTSESASDPDAVTTPTFKGDLVAFLGALSMAVYLLCGESLRRASKGLGDVPTMPLWLYAFPVTAVATITCVILAVASDPGSITIYSSVNLDKSVLGFLSWSYVPFCLYLGGFSGVGGHTLLNTLLAYLTPTVVGTSLLAEPVIGGVIGYAVGVQGVPGGWTWGGGAVLVGGLVMTVKGGEGGGGDMVRGEEGKGWVERGGEGYGGMEGEEEGVGGVGQRV
jgi:drug/metabolite transporter (DMT)-like permease